MFWAYRCVPPGHLKGPFLPRQVISLPFTTGPLDPEGCSRAVAQKLRRVDMRGPAEKLMVVLKEGRLPLGAEEG